MLKYLPFVCVILLTLSACSHHGTDADTATSPPPAPAPAPATKPASPAAVASSQDQWVQGKHYFLIQPAHPTNQPGKVVVTEVFSFACVACNAFHQEWDRLVQELPANVVIQYLPASFGVSEDWPVFQRAYFTARALGIEQKSHDAMFDAVWKNGKLAIFNLKDVAKGQLHAKIHMPTLHDIAKFYAQYGIKPKQFIDVAHSFSVNMDMKRADKEVMSIGINMTPAIIVNGKYYLTPSSAGGFEKMMTLTKWLVAREGRDK